MLNDFNSGPSGLYYDLDYNRPDLAEISYCSKNFCSKKVRKFHPKSRKFSILGLKFLTFSVEQYLNFVVFFFIR